MLFNSFAFAGLLLVTFILYYLPKISRFQVLILVISSLIFYAYDQPELVFLLLFSGVLNVLVSYQIAFGEVKQKKAIVASGVIINLTVLAFFKYSSLISITFFDPKDSIGEFLLHIPLPIGISFFTFEGISLLVDVFKGDRFDNKKLIPKSLLKHAERTLFFISFFPHLVAGPILKAHDFYPQIGRKTLSAIDWTLSFKKLTLGYFLKMVVADNLKDFTFWIAYPYFKTQSGLNLVVMLFGYSFQIFADFAGYSLIAIGLANLFGYRFNDNFNFPYISASFREFWKRWHISLSSFLMEYLYFPLGGSKKGKARTYLNLMITMILGGLWHGAAWSYAVWGAVHGLALAVERFVNDHVNFKAGNFVTVLKTCMVFLFVTLAWLLFKLPDFNHVIIYLKSIYTNWNVAVNINSIIYISVYSSPVILYHVFFLIFRSNRILWFKNREAFYYAILLFLILLNSGSSGSFIYFQF